jgi:hypothetical protein
LAGSRTYPGPRGVHASLVPGAGYNIAIHTKKQPDKTEEQHQQRHRKHTHHVLDKLEEHDLYLKPKKYAFAKEEIEYLGVIIGQNRIRMDPGKLKGIADWPVP